MPSILFSPNSHLRHSHYFNNQAPPPSSFSRSASGVRDSLRRIPSSLFAKTNDNEKKPQKVKVFDEQSKKSIALVDHPRPLAPSPKRHILSFRSKESKEEKDSVSNTKTRGKTRKALADILGWGNHSNIDRSTSSPTSSPKPVKSSVTRADPLPPPLPVKDDAPTMPAVLRKKPSARVLSAKVSNSKLAPPPPSAMRSLSRESKASLKAPSHDSRSRARPSMAPDPFGKTDDGAEVIEVAPSRAVETPSIITIERRSSATSGKAHSTKTIVSDSASGRAPSTQLSTGTTLVQSTATSASFPRNDPTTKPAETAQKHVSAPLPLSSATSRPQPRQSLGLVEPSAARPLFAKPIINKQVDEPVKVAPRPERTSSLRPSDNLSSIEPKRWAVHSTVKEPKPVIQPINKDETIRDTTKPAQVGQSSPATQKTMKRDKTKSRILGIFRGRKDSHRESAVTVDTVRSKVSNAGIIHSAVQPSEPAAMTSRVSLRSSRSVFETETAGPTKGASRPPPPPTLHLIKPSVDGISLENRKSTSTLRSVSRDASVHGSPPFSTYRKPPPKVDEEAIEDFDESLTSPTLNGKGRVWETTASSANSMGSVGNYHGNGGTVTTITGVRGKTVPKRKSLTGLFGLAMKKSFERIRPARPPSSFNMNRMEVLSSVKTMTSLAEELEEADSEVEVGQGETTVNARNSVSVESHSNDFPGDWDLSHVASATDMLFDLVAHNEFSPAGSSPASTATSPPSSMSADGSPTPMRRVKSAVLTHKKSAASPLRPGTNISPLRFALHQSQLADQLGQGRKGQRPHSSPASSPLRMSMVKKGMKNIFAPPAHERGQEGQLVKQPSNSKFLAPPEQVKRRVPIKTLPVHSVTEATLKPLGNREGLRSMEDIPKDLSAIVTVHPVNKALPALPPSEGLTTNHLGLPVPPPADRITPRRPANRPPGISLPPIPDDEIAKPTPPGRVSRLPPQLALEIKSARWSGLLGVPPAGDNFHSQPASIYSESVVSDMLSPDIGTGDNRNSFDFTGEYASLDQGTQRISFVEALAKFQRAERGIPPLPRSPGMLDLHKACEQAPEDYTLQTNSTHNANNTFGLGIEDKPAYARSKRESYQTSHSESDASDAIGLASEASGTDDEASMIDALINSTGRSPQSPRSAITSLASRASTSPSATGRSPRPPPFKGNPVFQQRISQVKDNMTPHASTSPEVVIGSVIEPSPQPPRLTATLDCLPAAKSGDENAGRHARMASLEPPPVGRFGHDRADSGLSIDSMSSIGAVIETGISGEYTNYFEVNFANHLIARAQQARALHLPPPATQRTDSSDTILPHHSVSRQGLRGAAVGPKQHHRRNSSIASLESIGVEPDVASGPPISMHNTKRASYVSRHRRDGSEGSFGRPDWASHRRGSSGESAGSISSSISVARLVRPGLGERMFLLDGGVQLTSITGSPAEEELRSRGKGSIVPSEVVRYERRSDEFFGHTSEARAGVTGSGHGMTRMESKDFIIHPLRPVSVVTNSSCEDEEIGDDTSINVAKYAKHLMPNSPSVAQNEECFEGLGEDDTMRLDTAPGAINTSISSIDSALLSSSSISRPARPRRRPATLTLQADAQPETPVLSSPSASESSSRFSLDTKADGASLFSGIRGKPFKAGHQRQKSSVGVKVHATIKEEPSIATLRAYGSNIPSDGVPGKNATVVKQQPSPTDVLSFYTGDETDGDIQMSTLKSWLDWEREAEDVCRRGRDMWYDSEESKKDLAEFRAPQTAIEIAQFLAQSNATYKPLDELPFGRPAHRRQSSRSDSRLVTSPYGLPLPRPTQETTGRKKGSLQTKFERTNSTNSTTSSDFSFGKGSTSPRTDSPFASFFPTENSLMPDNDGTAKFNRFSLDNPSSAASVLSSAGFSPFALPQFDGLGLRGAEQKRSGIEEKRARVTSNARRQALGWGRRRNSDGPVKVDTLSRIPRLIRGDSEGAPLSPVQIDRNIHTRGIAQQMTYADEVPVVPAAPEKYTSERSTIPMKVDNALSTKRSRLASKSSRKTPKRVQSQPLAMRI